MKKKTTIDKLAHKYALNIKQIRGPGPQKVADFKNLNKNFYDDIESSNVSIRDSTKILDDIKNKSIKEFIYTNKVIPDIWKKKLNYQDELIKVITTDKNLLSYVGTSSRGEKKFSVDNKFPKINSRYGAMNLTRSRNSEINNSDRIRSERTYIQNKDNDQSNISDSYNIGIRNKFSFSKKNELSEKEINALMEEYKTAFPIKEKLQELYITSNYYKINKNKNDQMTSNDENSENRITNAHQTHNSINSNTMSQMKRNTYNSLSSVSKKIVSKKQKTFRQNIFNNLSPSNESNTFYTLDKSNLINMNKSSNVIMNKNAKVINAQKLIDITNPIIKKNVESINNFGPYFSYCPSCRNKNMDFYNNLEPNHCLELIHYIKKIRHKNPILEIRRRTASVSPNIQSSNQKETVESDRILSENEKEDNFV